MDNKTLIELRINLLKADRFIKVHNDPIAAQQIITDCLTSINVLLEAEETSNDNELLIHDVSNRNLAEWLLKNRRSVFIEADITKEDKTNILHQFNYSATMLD